MGPMLGRKRGLLIPAAVVVALGASAVSAVSVIAGVSLVGCSSDPADEEATPNPNGKLEGAECDVGFDCRSGLCHDNHCAPSAGLDGSPTDGVKNGDESDVDCGGSRAPKCAAGKACRVAGDCGDGVCKAGTCAAPSPDDGIKNGDESDVDCGGTKAPKCGVAKACAAHADCSSDACSFEKKCVEYKGCTAHAGGDTCGEGETGAAGAKHESCCNTIAITDRSSAQGGPFSIDKFQVTAGRMRAFVERYDGDLQKWAAQNPKGWNAAWNVNLPASMSDALYLLGPGGKIGCNVASQGGRTYSQPAIDGDNDEKSDFSQDVLDEKGLNCVSWYLAQAVCMWDGGHLASADEIRWAYENRGRAGGATTYPWQWKDTSAYNASGVDPRVVHNYSYETPNPPAAMRMVNGQYPLDHAFYIAPPGRRPTGANKDGVQDMAGNIMPWVSDGPKQYLYTMSWEEHPKSMGSASTWSNSSGPEGYYAIGARCSR